MAATTDVDSDLRLSSSARMSLETIRKAVNSLTQWKATKSRNENPQLLPDEEFVYLNLTLKKIPPKGRVNAHKISLPNPLHSLGDTELCLIIDDREKSKLSKAEVKKKVEAEEIGVGKILKLSKLKTDYRAYEAKRKLCDSYDMFLVDKRIVPLMPKLLGKQFYKKKKIPVQIDLTRKNWKEQISRAIGSGLLYLRTGTCSVMKVARVSMDMEDIVENVVSAINGIVEILPKKWDSVRSFHLKLNESLSLPIYQALPDLKLKIDGGVRNGEEKDNESEVIDGAKKDESAVRKKSSMKGRIHEVRYMDSKINSLGSESDLGSEDDSDDGTVHDHITAEIEDAPIKKRKMSTAKLEKNAGERKAKKHLKSGVEDGVQQKTKKAISGELKKAGEKKLKVGRSMNNEIVEDMKDKSSGLEEKKEKKIAA